MSDIKLILDLDGVFADFTGAACVIHGRPGYEVTGWGFYEDWGLTEEEFWAPIRAKGDCFYEHIVQPYPWACELLTLCQEYDKNFVFASVAGGQHADDYSGKVRFVRKYLGDIPIIVVPPGFKQLLAAHGRVLIDDSGLNVIDWREHGGQAVLFPQYWNASHSYRNDRVRYVRRQLERLMK